MPNPVDLKSTHSYRKTRKRVIGKQCRHNVTFDQSLQCLLTGFSIKIEKKRHSRPDIPKMTNGLVQHITLEEFTSTQPV